PLCALAGCGRIGFQPIDVACQLGPFGASRPLLELNTSAGDQHPSLSPDRLTIWFDSGRSGTGQIMRATRPAIDAPFGSPEVVPIALPGTVGDPTISDDGLTLWFANAPTAVDQYDLYMATRPTTTADFTTPQPLTVLDSTANDFAPSTTSDELTLV